MPKYVHPAERERRLGKGVVSRLEVINTKIGSLLDKEWDSMEDEDMEQLLITRRRLEEMIRKYRR
jgi:hypothetical protein